MKPLELDFAVWPIFTAMTRRGLRVDVGRFETLRREVEEKLEVYEAGVRAVAGWDLNPYSPDHVGKWLRESGLAKGKRTKTGKTATDERTLALIGDAHPLPPMILECRGLRKLVNTFIDPVLELVDGMDEPTVFPRWRLTQVRSGRPSCEGPNLLAFPTRDAFGKRVRECFVARPGHKLISIDYSQIEPRVGAALSADPGLVAVFAEKRDLYADMARRIFRLPSSITDKMLKDDETLSRQYRQPAKIILLGCVMYGMGAKHLFEEFIKWGCGTVAKPNFDEAQCQDFVERRFEPYPLLGRLVEDTVRAARALDGWAMTLGHRGRFLPALMLSGWRWPPATMRAEAERQAFNHLVQGTAQEIMKEGMLRVDAAQLPIWPLLQVYDEMVYEVPAAQAAELKERLRAIMSTELRGVAIPAGGSVADSWGGLK